MFNNKGVTLVELLVVMGIMTVLIGMSTASVGNINRRANLNTTTSVLVNDIKSQQIQAMSGMTAGGNPSGGDSFGIHFNSTSYTLFQGTYNAASTANLIVNFPPNVVITNPTGIPGSEIVFTPGTGVVTGFTAGQNVITFKNNISNELKSVTFNRYGVVTSLQ